MKILALILSTAAICALGFFIRRAVKSTPFERKCPCAPPVDHLKRLEDADPRWEKRKKENLW